MKKTQFRATITMKNPFKKSGFVHWDGRVYVEDNKGYVNMYGRYLPLSGYYRSSKNSGYVLVYVE